VSANLDLARSIYTDWERGDFSSDKWAHPEIEYVFADGPSPGIWKGLAGLVEGWRGFLSAWEQFHVAVDEYRELDDEHVLVLLSFRGRGKASGLKLEQMRAKGAGMIHFRDGKVTKAVFYLNRERALTELGLASEADSPSA
jgi:ketosteroid isomerase-like protein